MRRAVRWLPFGYFRFRFPVPSNRKPAKRLRFEKEEQRRELALTYKISRSKRYIACSDVVPVVGLEPTRCRHRRILNPLRLPFHHTGKVRCYYSVLFKKFQERFALSPPLPPAAAKESSEPVRCPEISQSPYQNSRICGMIKNHTGFGMHFSVRPSHERMVER